MKKILSFLGISGVLFGAAIAQNQFPAAQKLRMAEAAVAQLYVDTINEDKLVEDAIKGMLEGLDPHSQYSSPEETRELNEPLAGNFSGIGITFNMSSDTLYVIQTVSGGPSEKVGILAGDRIIEVDDTVIAGVKMKNRDVMRRLRGEKGTTVDVKVLRRTSSRPDTIDFRITRADIPIYSVDAAYMVDPTTGYIRVNKFSAETASEVRKALKDLRKHGMKDLILDLTDNGGGYLQAAVDILGEFLEPRSLAVYTEGMRSPRQELKTMPSGLKPLFDDGRLVVMANQYSASAAEITSGAIQDWDRGLIVGRRTFGKGLVQRPIPFPDGSMMRLTTAHYYTPTGRDIQKPYIKGGQKEYEKDIMERFNHGELMHEDSIKYVDSLRTETLRYGRTIYGGGGIYPDRFVALDTMANTKYYRNVVAKGDVNRYVMDYVDAHRKEIKKKYKTDDDFVKGFNVTPEMLQGLYDMATADGVEFDAEQAELSRSLFSMVLKALIGRDIYDNATYFKVYNLEDPIFKNAYDLIKSDEYNRLLK